MIKISTYLQNPILYPDPKVAWEAKAVFNPSLIFEDGKYSMVFRAMSNSTNYEGKDLELSTIAITESDSKVEFKNERRQLIIPEYPWEKFGCEDPRITKIDDEFFIFYTAISSFPPDKNSIKIAVALSDNLIHVKEKHLVTPFNAKAMALFPKKINGKFVAILTPNTDNPPSKIAIAQFDKKEDLWSENFWNNWYKDLDKHSLPLQRLTSDQIEVGAVPVETEDGWILLYAHIQNYYSSINRIFGIEAVLLSHNDPTKIIGRTTEPLLIPQEEYELGGVVPNVIFPSGALIEDDKLYIYYGAADTTTALATCNLPELLTLLKSTPIQKVEKLTKFSGNPILEPTARHSWETQCVFNPAAIYEDGKFYIVYRAMSQDNTSVLGLAISSDGFKIDDRLDKPIYIPRIDMEIKNQENGFSGCEDPRITKIGDRFYMCYTAYNGIISPKVALTSIAVKDFLDQNWNWEIPKIISSGEIDDKNACIFPEKIKGKYVFLHREGGRNMAFDYQEDLEFADNKVLQKIAIIEPREDSWDSQKIGISSPPIKTDKGWLLLYHGVSKYDSQYRVGAMLLELEKPENVLSRTKFPILEPETDFERIGVVNNVVFPCGAVLKDEILYIYYGGADKVVCVATANINDLLKNLL